MNHITFLAIPQQPKPRSVSSKRNVIGMRVGLYNEYFQATFGVSSLAAAKPLPNNQTEYPSKHLSSPISLQQIISRWELVPLTASK